MSRQHPWRAENPVAVIVARPSKWGNPFGFSVPEKRQAAVDEYRMLLTGGSTTTHMIGGGVTLKRIPAWHEPADLRAALHELAGKDLACWCPLDQPCHADVLLELANGVTS